MKKKKEKWKSMRTSKDEIQIGLEMMITIDILFLCVLFFPIRGRGKSNENQTGFQNRRTEIQTWNEVPEKIGKQLKKL